MNAVHINWTKPYFERNSGEYRIEDFEIMTTVLSALKWQEKNGSIRMITDSVGYEYYIKNNMAELWDGGISVELDGIKENAYMFWAAGKLHALQNEKAPIAVIDTDFIVWEEILFEKLGDLTVIHDEDLYPDIYPDVNAFRMKSGYRFHPSWNWKLKSLNTAFYVIKNQKLLDEYTKEAIYFMNNAEPQDDPLRYMVFAEQRLLPMAAAKIGCTVDTFSNLERLFRNGEGWFTHVWGMKQQMRENEELRELFCLKCAARIIKDFPKWAEKLKKNSAVKKYFN